MWIAGQLLIVKDNYCRKEGPLIKILHTLGVNQPVTDGALGFVDKGSPARLVDQPASSLSHHPRGVCCVNKVTNTRNCLVDYFFPLLTSPAESRTWTIHLPLRGLLWKSAALLRWGQADIHMHTLKLPMSSVLIFPLSLQLYNSEECISFTAIQRVPIGLLQPAPAVFYDYYEPSRPFLSLLRIKSVFISLIHQEFVLYVNSLQTLGAPCSILPPKEASWSPNCVHRTCVSAQKVGRDFYWQTTETKMQLQTPGLCQQYHFFKFI